MRSDQEHSFFHSGYRQILSAFQVPSSIPGCQPWHRPNSSNNRIISSPQDGQNKEYTVFAMLGDMSSNSSSCCPSAGTNVFSAYHLLKAVTSNIPERTVELKPKTFLFLSVHIFMLKLMII